MSTDCQVRFSQSNGQPTKPEMVKSLGFLYFVSSLTAPNEKYTYLKESFVLLEILVQNSFSYKHVSNFHLVML